MNDGFKFLSCTEKLIAYMNKLLPNFPKKEDILKRSIESNQYDLIRCVHGYQLNCNDSPKVANRFLKDYLLDLSMFDFFLKTSFSKRLISHHQVECMTRIIEECRKICYGIIRSEKGK